MEERRRMKEDENRECSVFVVEQQGKVRLSV